jgi:tetratricopeptide (TPR) repeat protein
MGYLLETLGRGLLGRLADAFERHFPRVDQDAEDLLRNSNSTSADALTCLGVALLREERLASARQAFERALACDDPGIVPQLGLACVCDELGQPDSTLDLLRRAAVAQPDDPAIAFAIGYCEERAGRAEHAVAAYTTALRLCPRLRNAHERIAAMAVLREDWDTACDAYRKLSRLEGQDLDIRLTIAALELRAGRATEAVAAFQSALLVEPEALESPAKAQGDPRNDAELRSAIAAAQDVVEKYPGATEFHVHLADLLVKAGQDDRAVRHYETAIELHPGFLEATVKLGTQHLRAGRIGQAAETFNRAVELNDRLLLAFVGLAVAQRHAGLREDSDSNFDLAAGLAPNTTLLFAESARLRLKALEGERPDDTIGGAATATIDSDDHMTEIVRRHEQAIMLRGAQADLHYRYALLLRQVGEFDEAAATLRRAVQISPSFAKAQVLLGVTLRELGQPGDAAAFERALALDSAEAKSHYELALLFSQRCRFQMALERFGHTAADEEQCDAMEQNMALSLQHVGMVDRVAASWRCISELAAQPPILDESRFASRRGGRRG